MSKIHCLSIYSTLNAGQHVQEDDCVFGFFVEVYHSSVFAALTPFPLSVSLLQFICFAFQKAQQGFGAGNTVSERQTGRQHSPARLCE